MCLTFSGKKSTFSRLKFNKKRHYDGWGAALRFFLKVMGNTLHKVLLSIIHNAQCAEACKIIYGARKNMMEI